MSFTLKIDGVADLQKAFEEKRKEIEEVIIKDLDEGADVIKTSAKSKVHSISGALKDSINRNKVLNHGGKIDVYIGVDVNQKFTPSGLYGIAVEKGHAVEKGTSKVPAHPFLRPAFDENKKQIKDKIESDIKEVVND